MGVGVGVLSLRVWEVKWVFVWASGCVSVGVLSLRVWVCSVCEREWE